MAGGYFFNGVVHEDLRTDFGVYTEERGVNNPHEMTQLVKEDRAFQVEVKEIQEGVNISLISDSREISVDLEEKLEKRGNLSYTLYQSDEKALMPGDYDNPHNAISMYAEYALRHKRDEGIEMDFEWDNVLDEENRSL